MRVVVTGANGFVGTYITRFLKRDGHEVVGAVRRTADTSHIADQLDGQEIFDLQDGDSLRRVGSAGQVVVHNAVDFPASADPMGCFEVNVLGSLRLLEYARQARAGQYIFISSGAAYAEILQDRLLDECHPTWPDSIYGAYKAGVEPFLKAYHTRYGMNTVSLRPVGIYGIAPKLDRSQWYGLVRDVKAGRAIDTAHGGKVVHVEDVAGTVALAIGNDDAAGEFYNLVDCYIYDQTVGEMARDLCGSDARIIDRKGTGPKNTYTTTKTERLGIPLNRGHEGVRQYLRELLDRMG